MADKISGSSSINCGTGDAISTFKCYFFYQLIFFERGKKWKKKKKILQLLTKGLRMNFLCIAALAHSCLRGGSNKNQTKVKIPGRIHL